MLDKFIKLDGTKGYGKCIEFNSKLIAPQEFEYWYEGNEMLEEIY